MATLGREWAGASRGRSRAGARRRPELGLAIPWLPVASLPYVLLIMLPLLGLIGRALLTGDLVAAVRNPIVVDALWLSVTTASLSTVATFVIGSPFALLIARWRGLCRNLVETLVDLPLVLPPTVAGLALLITFGRRGVLGPTLSFFGVELPFTTAAVVIAQLFVSAPLYVRTAIIGFGSLPREVSEAAALDGAGRWGAFRHVILPLTSPLLLGGAVMTWARALGEFGATIMFAGNLPGRTQTMPLAIYGAFEQDLDASIGLAIFLVLASGLVLMLVRALTQRRLADTLRALVG